MVRKRLEDELRSIWTDWLNNDDYGLYHESEPTVVETFTGAPASTAPATKPVDAEDELPARSNFRTPHKKRAILKMEKMKPQGPREDLKDFVKAARATKDSQESEVQIHRPKKHVAAEAIQKVYRGSKGRAEAKALKNVKEAEALVNASPPKPPRSIAPTPAARGALSVVRTALAPGGGDLKAGASTFIKKDGGVGYRLHGKFVSAAEARA